ncbi:MAG: hypothetical protein KJ955_01495 [Nanoarchaeota archaeon]|nr:hypothetical protein [Nanoarchaeota archaeon]
MAHKRYIKRNGKVYGPYLYESKRVNGKVKNVYHGLDKSGRWKTAGIAAIILAILFLTIAYADFSIQSGSSSGANSNLTVWDGTSAGAENPPYWYSNCTGAYPNCAPEKLVSEYTILVFANYSNSTVGPIMGNCSIRFNYTGTYGIFSEMVYNPSSKLYEFNSSFNRRSNHSTQFMFQANCSNITYDTLNATDYFEIKNTPPFQILGTGATATSQSCTEDTTCTYDVSANFTDDDDNDLPLSNFNIFNATSSFSDCLTPVVGGTSSSGVIEIACTNSNQAGSNHYFTAMATDRGSSSSAPITIPYTITAVNDYPLATYPFSVCSGHSANVSCSGATCTCYEDSPCCFYVNAWDEENGTISAGSGSGIGSLNFTKNATLAIMTINSSNGSVLFIPENEHVGIYKIKLNITDPNNAINTSEFTLTISDRNDPPNLTYACDNIDGVPLTEDTTFSCMLNASDIDEGDTHTYTANYTWFTINCNNKPVTDGNSSCNVTFAPTDIAVYSHWINITVNDSGNLKSSRLLNFSVNNVADFPQWVNITNMTAWANVSFWYRVHATDDDSLTVFGDNVTYSANYTWFNINRTTGVIQFNNSELNDKAGITYWVNITANDTTNRQNSTVINFTIYQNSYPYITIVQEYNLTEGYAFSLNISANVTEPDGDYVNYTDNTSLFDINIATGIITFTPTDNEVGTHWVAINITDSHGTTNTSIFNFTVYNEADAPVLGIIYNITNASEGTAVTFNLNLTDADLNISGGPESIHILANATWPGTSTLLNVTVTRLNQTSLNPPSGRVAFDISFTPGPDSNGTYWLNITINDSAGLGDSQIFFINVSEGGFPPFFLDEQAFFCSTREATEDTPFASCRIWACDNDTGGTLRFGANYSWFTINTSNIPTVDYTSAGHGYCTNVTLNFTPTYQEVGNWSVYLNVTDNLDMTANYTLYFNISSVNDAPVLAYIGVLNASIDSIFSFYVNASDEEDGNVTAGAGAGLGKLTFSDNTSLFEINSSTGLITWSTNSSHEGTHYINITVNDTSGAEDSQVINITVSANVAPNCSAIWNTYLSITVYDPRTEAAPHINITENAATGNFNANCEDEIEGDTIKFSWYWNGSLNRTNTASSGTGAKSDSWNYTTTYLDSGYYNMTLVVWDSSVEHNNSYHIIVNVSNVNAPPMMYSNIPNISSLNSGAGWYNNIQNSRNMTTWFYDMDNDNLTYSWHRQSINETFSDNSISRINSIWTLSGNWSVFEDTSNNYAIKQNDTSGLKYAQLGNSLNYTDLTEFKVRIKLLSEGGAGVCLGSIGCASGPRIFLNSTDNRTYLQYLNAGTLSSLNSSSQITIVRNTSYWLKAIVEANLTTIYTSSNGTEWDLAYNQSVNVTTGSAQIFTINAEAVFDDIALKDPDLRNMTLADIGGNNITFTPKTGWYGDLSIVVRASDGINYTDSNEFNLHVDQVHVLPPEVVTQTSTSTSTRTETKVADLSLIVPSMISLTPLSKTIIPVILKNTGQLNLNTITLTAESNQSELKLTLNESSWDIITIGDSIRVNLDVDIGLLAPDRYTIRLEAISQMPYLERVAEIVVDVREKDAVLKAQLKEMIQFTRDLFLQNPECLELSELISEAEKLMSVYQYNEGLELIHRANQGCKEFIAASKKESEKEQATALSFIQEHWKTLVLEMIGLILAILLLIYYFQRRQVSKA